MTETAGENPPNDTGKKETGEHAQMESLEPGQPAKPETRPANLRQASYIVLFIAAVFVVNAMETGSYRTPWPVAIITALAGLGLFGYSWYRRFDSRP